MSEIDNAEEIGVLCHGCYADGKKVGTALQLLDDNGEPTGKIMHFKEIKHACPATYCTVKAIKKGDDNLTIWPHTLTFVCEMVDAAKAAEIKAASKAAKDDVMIERKLDKIRKDDDSEILAIMKPLRRAWQKTNYSGRLALEVRVLSYLRNGTDL